MEKLESIIKYATYENIFVDCPYCSKNLIFNRISDLLTVEPIFGKNLKCQHCGNLFWATSDIVELAKYRWFLGEVKDLEKQKKYGLCILLLCQACETFMHQAIINKNIDRNVSYRDKNDGSFTKEYAKIYEEFCDKEISEILYNKKVTNKRKYKPKYIQASFEDLRKLFLDNFNYEKNNELTTLKKLKEDKRVKYFEIIENTTINQTRNKVIHKDAYRPGKKDVLRYKNLIDSLYWLGAYLEIEDSCFYLNKKIYPS